MPSDHPHTPQSPSQTPYNAADLPSKPVTSPRPNSLPTPAHSINGSMSAALGLDVALEGVSHDEPSNKRKRDLEDNGDREQKKVHVESARLSIEDLHLDVGVKYLVCRTPHRPLQQSLSEDLYERFGLTEIAKSVARREANGTTGVKLRKTYKNYIKNLGLSGDFEPEKKEREDPSTLLSLALAPAEEWDAQNTRGKEIGFGIPDNILASMGKAFTMSKGSIPKSTWNSAVLGELSAPVAPQPTKVAHGGVKVAQAHTPHAAQTAGSKEIPRPKRNIKKRAYGDASFEGYGEGYVDDELHDTGYSTNDGEERGARKRPKKTMQSHSNFQQGQMRQNSYGPGMVGA